MDSIGATLVISDKKIDIIYNSKKCEDARGLDDDVYHTTPDSFFNMISSLTKEHSNTLFVSSTP